MRTHKDIQPWFSIIFSVRVQNTIFLSRVPERWMMGYWIFGQIHRNFSKAASEHQHNTEWSWGWIKEEKAPKLERKQNIWMRPQRPICPSSQPCLVLTFLTLLIEVPKVNREERQSFSQHSVPSPQQTLLPSKHLKNNPFCKCGVAMTALDLAWGKSYQESQLRLRTFLWGPTSHRVKMASWMEGRAWHCVPSHLRHILPPNGYCLHLSMWKWDPLGLEPWWFPRVLPDPIFYGVKCFLNL